MRDLIRWTSSLLRRLLHGVRVLMPILVGSKIERTSRRGTGTSISKTKCRHSSRSHSKFKLIKLRYKQVLCAHYASNRKDIPRVLRIKNGQFTQQRIKHHTFLPPRRKCIPQITKQQTRDDHLFTINALGGEYHRWSETNYHSGVQYKMTLVYIKYCSRKHW
jgi:hypothetical protein